MGLSRGVRAVLLGAAPMLVVGAVLAIVAGVYAPDVVTIGIQPASDEGALQRAAELRQHLPDRFVVVASSPFVVVSDAPLDQVDAALKATRQAVAAVRKRVAPRDPAHVIDLWLFRDEDYRQGARTWLGEWPPTRLGYYAPRRHALIVNLAAGPEAVAHEVVHPLVQASFPGCPVWLDEGLASLVEHDLRHQRLEAVAAAESRRLELTQRPVDVGARDLQRLASSGRLRSIAALTVANGEEFYANAWSTYTQARLVVAFLRQHGLLGDYLSQLRSHIDEDQTGMKTLEAVAARAGLTPLEGRWREYLATL